MVGKEVAMRELGPFIAGSWWSGAPLRSVRSPYDGREVSRIGMGGSRELAVALEAAAAARELMASLPPHTRATILDRASRGVTERSGELAEALADEAGKPLALASTEAERCAETFAEAARVARRPESELVDLGGFPSGEGRFGLLRRFPVGVVVGITPFNFPLNLVAHKLAPAIAAGCPIVLKPASQTPSPALLLAAILHDAGAPAGTVNVVPCAANEMGILLDDVRVRLVTFTGSAEVGWGLKRRLWDRRVTLELGGNAAVVVEPDAGDLATVARRIAVGAFAYAGQSCISVQRVLVHESIATGLRGALVEATRTFPSGDPAAPDVLCGPMISAGDADRIEGWVEEATRRGASLLTPLRREGNIVRPVLLEDVPRDASLWADEAFAPVAVLATYRSFEEALDLVNDSRFGLQAGIFTANVAKIQRAFEHLEVGGIIQGDIPSWRTDAMPYGGVKQSGIGREGPRWAVEEMTEPRLLVLRRT
jgi:acyl-CoA reductase-like NAD-dependent aldehyde dehydrogenase